MKKFLSYVTAFSLALSVYGGFAREGSAETNEVEQNETKETATKLSFSTSSDENFPYETFGNGSFEQKEDVDFYQFSLEKDGGINVSLSQLKTANFGIELYNTKDEVLQSWEVSEGEETIDVFYEGLPAGKYYIKLWVKSGTVAATSNSYSMKILYSNEDYLEKETNNTLQTATSMTLNKNYIGFTDSESDDFYKIKTTSNGKLTIKGSYSENVELSYVLLDAKGKLIEDWTINPNEENEITDIFTVGVAKGTYYLVVTHDYKDEYANEAYITQAKFTADNYSEKESNETSATATPVLLKQKYNAILSWKTDVDTFKLNMTATGNVTLNMSQAPKTTFKVVVVNSKNKVIKTFYTKVGKGSNVTIGTVNLPKGTYFIKVQYNKGDYYQVPYKLNLQPKK